MDPLNPHGGNIRFEVPSGQEHERPDGIGEFHSDLQSLQDADRRSPFLTGVRFEFIILHITSQHQGALAAAVS